MDSNETSLSPGQLVPGRTYRVEFEDCCAEGWFISTFVHLRYDDQEPDALDAVVFETGEIGPDWSVGSKVTIREETGL